MANILSIATALPKYCHEQKDILKFMQHAFGLNETDKRKLSFLYSQSGIEKRYSVIPDFSLPEDEWTFIASEVNPFPTIEDRLEVYKKTATSLSVEAIEKCLDGYIEAGDITHLITVSCTGMSAPGLDLEVIEAMQLSPTIFRTSVNFMGCYAAIHALKLAKMICDSEADAKVVIVSTELCTIHFQQNYTLDNAASSLLFGDGTAAVLLSNDATANALSIDSFYSTIASRGKQDMSWEISTKGFLMTLSGYVPQLIEEDIAALVQQSLNKSKKKIEEITHWCLHPGGRKILDTIEKQLSLTKEHLSFARKVLNNYGNMSSPTILFVLKEMMESLKEKYTPSKIFGVAFGPGLTMETFIATA